MKIFVIEMNGLDPEILLGDDVVAEQLVNFHRMMELGCYGTLQTVKGSEGDGNKSLSDYPGWGQPTNAIASFDGKGKEYGDLATLKRKIFDHARKSIDQIIALLPSEDWEYLEYIDTGLSHIQSMPGNENHLEDTRSIESTVRDYYLYFNEQLGRIFENIDQDLVFTMISKQRLDDNGSGFFILTAPNNPLEGEIEGASALDIYTTILDLAGYRDQVAIQGKSLVEGLLAKLSAEELTKAEEDILRERLSGLGYLS